MVLRFVHPYRVAAFSAISPSLVDATGTKLLNRREFDSITRTARGAYENSIQLREQREQTSEFQLSLKESPDGLLALLPDSGSSILVSSFKSAIDFLTSALATGRNLRFLKKRKIFV